MRRLSIVLFASLAVLGALLLPGAAEAKTSKRQKAAVPTIKLVSPMRVRVGRTITIRGKGFSRSRKRNTVLFKSRNGRSAFAKASRASSTKLVVRIPAAAERLLTLSAGKGVATRLTLRVVTSRYGKASKRRHSPVVFSALATGKTAACGRGDDWDTDLLPNDVELKFALDPCKADTDGDRMGDGWEYYSGRDLNARAVPYPGKRRYTNPLDASDAGIDYDGDILTSVEEHRAWVVTGRNFEPGNPYTPLGYSDGTQSSRPFSMPGEDANRDGQLTDDERDADSDGLINYIESHGPGLETWWAATLAKENVEPWPGETTDSYWGEYTLRPFASLDMTDPDVDGDTVPDGSDDQDNDGWHNGSEMYARSVMTGAGPRKTNAFNPCAPDKQSRTCPRYKPVN